MKTGSGGLWWSAEPLQGLGSFLLLILTAERPSSWTMWTGFWASPFASSRVGDQVLGRAIRERVVPSFVCAGTGQRPMKHKAARGWSLSVCVSLCLCLSLCDRERQRQRDIDRQRQRQRDADRGRETETYAERFRDREI